MSELRKIYRVDLSPLRVRVSGSDNPDWRNNYVCSPNPLYYLDLRWLVKETEKTYTVVVNPTDKHPSRFRKDDYHWFFTEVEALAFLSIEAARLTERLRAAAVVADQLNTDFIMLMKAAQNGK